MTTPIRRQYLEVKRRFPNTIVFFRLGDFYETFDEDAQLVAKELEITLTSKPMAKDLRVPLAGVPYHALQAHLKRLVGRGYKVAICEQLEDPKQAKGIVARDVTRVVTPGTVVEEELLSAAANNYLAAVALAGGAPHPNPLPRGERGLMGAHPRGDRGLMGAHPRGDRGLMGAHPRGERGLMGALPRGERGLAGALPTGERGHAPTVGLAFVDITTGEFSVTELSEADLAVELARLAPAEVLLAEGEDLPAPFEGALTAVDRRSFVPEEAELRLREHFKVASLEAFGLRGLPLATAAAGAVIAYLAGSQRGALANVRDLSVYSPSGFMVLDPSARRHLELFASSREGGRRGSLIEVLDATRTSMGSRLLSRWLGQPLLDVDAIRARHDRVEAFHSDSLRRSDVRDRLREMPDVERIAGRIVAGVALPRDLAALRRGVLAFPGLIEAAGAQFAESGALRAAGEAGALLEAALAADPAPVVGEGGVIRQGFSPELDEARILTGDARKALAQLEVEERERSGIRSLRVAYNRVFGYYIEVSKANLAMVPDDFQRKQTLVNAERFSTPRLKDLEERILAANEQIGELEAQLFRNVCAQLAADAEGLHAVARIAAEIDVYAALADTAVRYGYVRPEVDDGERLEIHDGRHPVVERNLGDGRFVPNDTLLDCENAQIVVLTGPNMAGKSTYLRQVALITLMAQAGSFVPASSARIGAVDRIFTRIGAQDDVTRGESTFMVEMLETAAILRGATRRSLILFDEVGRGTSTYDGLAIARAVVEHLHARPERAAKTLFATHYHEMTALAATLPRVRNQSVAVTEQEGRVVFLHRIVEGGADRSYGIHVAELAGMPAPVIERARDVLRTLEEAGRNGASPAKRRAEPSPQLTLFGAQPPSEVETDLAGLDVDSLTPLQALTKLYELKAKLDRDQEAI